MANTSHLFTIREIIDYITDCLAGLTKAELDIYNVVAFSVKTMFESDVRIDYSSLLIGYGDPNSRMTDESIVDDIVKCIQNYLLPIIQQSGNIPRQPKSIDLISGGLIIITF